MNTAGFDCIIEVAEGFLNRSLSAAYHLTGPFQVGQWQD